MDKRISAYVNAYGAVPPGSRFKRTRTRVWARYRALKAYKRDPDPKHKKRLAAWIDRIFNRKRGFGPLDAALDALFDIKAELLLVLVLDRPDVPLHTNISEGEGSPRE